MTNNASAKKHFTNRLMAWHKTDNDRNLPWKSEKDPYKIWLSEVILQQTRAQQGLPYYLRFTEAYPTVQAMAAAADEDAYRIWQGLGYYNRCKNMLATARLVTADHQGRFPQSYDGLLSLRGIGPYTAAAIASFAFELPHAVVDGNVYRVLSRYFGIDTPIDSTEGKRTFTALAQDLLDISDSAAYNQAIMDLGATVCTPKNPKCNECPLQQKCQAYKQGLIALLPVKSKKLIVRKRYFHYLLLQWKDALWIHKRPAGDIWENLHEPLLIETGEPLSAEALQDLPQFKNFQLSCNNIKYMGSGSQRLTHQVINSSFYTVSLSKKPHISLPEGKWLVMNELKKVAFPKTVISFLENNFYF